MKIDRDLTRIRSGIRTVLVNHGFRRVPWIPYGARVERSHGRGPGSEMAASEGFFSCVHSARQHVLSKAYVTGGPTLARVVLNSTVNPETDSRMDGPYHPCTLIHAFVLVTDLVVSGAGKPDIYVYRGNGPDEKWHTLCAVIYAFARDGFGINWTCLFP